jgi:hypothetical protein
MIFSHSGAPNIKLNHAILDRAIEEFEAHGEITSHKPALVLHHVANYCVTNGIDFKLYYAVDRGFVLCRCSHDLASAVYGIIRNRIAASKGDVHAVETTDGNR